MTNKELYREFGNIDPSMVEAAAPAEKVRRMNGWIQWVAIAACLCLVVVCAFSLVPDSSNSTHKAPTVLFNDAEYYICGSRGEAVILKSCGLPEELTSDLEGAFVSYLVYDGECYYTPSDEKTAFVMFEYRPGPNTNVYVVLIDDIYYAAIRRDDNAFYGINGNLYKTE